MPPGGTELPDGGAAAVATDGHAPPWWQEAVRSRRRSASRAAWLPAVARGRLRCLGLWVLRAVLLIVPVLPMAFPLLTLGPGAYGPDRSAQGRPSLPPYTCNGVIDAQHFDRGNLLWDEIGDIYLGKMVLITFCSLAVAVLACLGTKPVVDPPAFVNNVRAWLLLNWLVAALWCFDRGCSWCTGGFMVDSSWNKWRQKACVAVWNAKQIVWAAAMVWICWLMKERVHALHGPQGSVGQRRQRMIVCLCRAQISFLVATTVLLLSGLLFDGSKERLVTSMQVLLVVITLCDTAVLVLAYLAFRHALHFALEEAQEAPVEQWRQEAKLVAWQARLQMAVTAVSATTSIASVACSFASHLMWAHFSGSKDPVFLLVKTGVYGLDLIANAAALLFIAGLVHCRCVDGLTGVSRHCHKPSEHTGWEAKVKELSERGFTLEALLDFYRVLGSRLMPHFDPDRHSTADVVREAIIPATASTPFGPCALATVLMNGAPTPAQRMVTHAWSGKLDLVAGVVGDALGCPTYDALLPRLRPAGLGSLKEELR
eukprot:CAMPEP_0168357580 /NCGR_PEP_ID=MMETSP0228-20121227/666_1 /TAXON_ID=133427 /ORGANISM="Protoceratium reticulatum, Strain CCCM 535 (=CCMP 1889)" /LENGTH=540 /DNA_ID=CAMNT_0008370115 /DNA_START=1 /DNA_END=1620 /DNA_ORIENTATION=-